MTEPIDPGPGITRRQLLAATALGGLAAGAIGVGRSVGQPGTGGTGSTGSSTARVRSNVYALAGTEAGRKTIESYRRGVAAMKAKPVADPTSWLFQAHIHGVARGAAGLGTVPLELAAAFNQCWHGDALFLPWHRLYIYYFERIVRKASGDPTFTLPYWNYSDSTAERPIPEAFRTPAAASNTLFDGTRRTTLNGGAALPDTIVDTSFALGQTFPEFRSRSRPGFYASVEGLPHNVVHGTISGNMGDPALAAEDPIFWLHHCNIDRLWAAWLRQGGGRRDISSTSFLDSRFLFYDENGTKVEPRAREAIDHAVGLGYRYDDEGAPRAALVLVQAQEPETGVEAGPADVELAASPAPVELGAEPAVTELAPLVEAGGASVFTTDPAAAAPRRKALVLSGVRYEQVPGTVFEIYLNRPDDAPFDPDGPFFAGLFAPFEAAPEEGVTVSFDISGLLNRQVEAGTYDGGPLKVEIRPFALEERDELPAVQIDRILIEREGG